MRRTPWQPRPGSYGAPIDQMAADPQEAWAPAPERSQVTTLERLLDRIPPHLAEAVRLHRLEGWTQAEVGALQGLSQPAICLRVRRATDRMARVAALGIDLVPAEVEEILRAAGERERVSRVVAEHWRLHSTALVEDLGIAPQATAWHMLHHGKWGFVDRRRDDPGMVGRVARATAVIRSWGRTRRWKNRGKAGS